jgi:hypothetical protein
VIGQRSSLVFCALPWSTRVVADILGGEILFEPDCTSKGVTLRYLNVS